MENEIMTELRKVREDMLSEFPSDEALLRVIKAQETELIRQGIPVVAPPPRPQGTYNPSAA